MFRIKKYISIRTLLVLSLLLSCYPYVFNILLGISNETLIMLIFLGIFGALFLKNTKSLSLYPDYLKKTLSVQIFTWSLYYIVHSDSSYVTRIVMILITTLALLALLSKNEHLKFCNVYNWWIALMALAGVPAFFLFAFGFLSPLSYYTNLDGREFAFFGLTCSNAFTAGICRVAGFFDEPGAFAFWGIFTLVSNKLFLQDRKLEIVLIVSLLTTLSAAYFVQLALYIVFFYSASIKRMITIGVVLIVVSFVTFNYLGSNDQLSYLTTERFEGGQIRSKRIEVTEQTQKIFADSPIIGIGAKKLHEMGYFDDNPYEIPAKDGLIGFIVTYLPLIVVAVRYGKQHRECLWGCLILAAGYMQRPFHINVLHFFMLYFFVLLAYYKYEKNNIYV